MKFRRLTNEFYGARNAGYKVDPSDYIVHFDPEAKADYLRRNTENDLDNIPDSLYDLDDDAYIGDDGNVYAVYFDFSAEGFPPLAWVKLVNTMDESPAKAIFERGIKTGVIKLNDLYTAKKAIADINALLEYDPTAACLAEEDDITFPIGLITELTRLREREASENA